MMTLMFSYDNPLLLAMHVNNDIEEQLLLTGELTKTGYESHRVTYHC